MCACVCVCVRACVRVKRCVHVLWETCMWETCMWEAKGGKEACAHECVCRWGVQGIVGGGRYMEEESVCSAEIAMLCVCYVLCAGDSAATIPSTRTHIHGSGALATGKKVSSFSSPFSTFIHTYTHTHTHSPSERTASPPSSSHSRK